ncbi:MAG: GumC family protein, partial [bacterium]
MYNDYTNGTLSNRPVTLRSFFIVLFKRKRIILSVFFAVVVTVTVGSFLMPPIFKATSKIMVEREINSEKALLFRMNFPLSYEKYDWIKSEIEIIKSYPVAARVVKELSLDKVEQKSKTLTQDEEKELFETTVKQFQKILKVENTRDSNVIEVIYEAKGPVLAAATVNKVIENYLSYRSEIYDESDTYKFFEEQMKIAGEKLRELEQRQATYKNQEDVISPQAQVEILLSKLADYEKSLTTVRTKRIGKEAKLAVIKEQMEKDSQINIPSTEVSDSPSREKYIAKLKGELLDMEIQRDRLLQRFKPTYEEIVELNRNIAATKEKIKGEIQQIIEQEETAIKTLYAEEKALQRSIDKINQEVSKFAQKEYEIIQLSRGIDDNREVYSMLLK